MIRATVTFLVLALVFVNHLSAVRAVAFSLASGTPEFFGVVDKTTPFTQIVVSRLGANRTADNFSSAASPEPSSLALLGMATVAIGLISLRGEDGNQPVKRPKRHRLLLVGVFLSIGIIVVIFGPEEVRILVRLWPFGWIAQLLGIPA